MNVGDIVKCQRAKVIPYESGIPDFYGMKIWVVAKPPLQLEVSDKNQIPNDGLQTSYEMPLIHPATGQICCIFQQQVELLPEFKELRVIHMNFFNLQNLKSWGEDTVRGQ